MSSMSSRSAVLILARLTNYAVLLLSPIVLIRILDVESYGQYREFVLYVSVATAILAFSSKGNLLYFIPQNPEKEHSYVFNTIIFLLATTTAGLLLVYFAKDFLVQYISFDFINLLICYVWLYVNLDLMQTFWLSKKRSDYVFIYSGSLLVVRMTAIVLTAYLTNDIVKIIYSMMFVEAIKFFLLALWWFKRLGISCAIDKEVAKQQLKYTIPLGIGGLIAMFNTKFGSMFVAAGMGPVALAIYSIGMYQIPVLDVIRSAVSDVIFPEMVQHNKNNKQAAMLLWQRANVIFCSAVFPVFLIFFFYATPFITLLFTEEYLEAVPIFQVMLFIMVRRCFELGTPLRSLNLNKFFLRSTLIALTANIAITFSLFGTFGLLSPAIAFLIADVLMAIYLAIKVLKAYSINISQLFLWKKLSWVIIATALGAPALIAGEYYGTLTSRMIAILVYCAIYYNLIRYYKLEEVEIVIQKINNKTGWAL